MKALGRSVTASHRALPGFRTELELTLLYLTVLLGVPLVACLAKVSSLTLSQFLSAVWTERARAAYLLTFGVSFAAAVINVPLGLLLAWILVRYQFPLKRVFDSLIDLPFALPTAVAGLVYANLTCQTAGSGGISCRWAFTGPIRGFAIVLVLTFIGLPFVVRTVQPVLETIERGNRGGGRVARRYETADVPARPTAVARSRVDDRICSHVRPLARRIRLGRVCLRQHHVQD